MTNTTNRKNLLRIKSAKSYEVAEELHRNAISTLGENKTKYIQKQGFDFMELFTVLKGHNVKLPILNGVFVQTIADHFNDL